MTATTPIDLSELTPEQLEARLARLHRQTTELAARLAGISFLWADSRRLWHDTKTEIGVRQGCVDRPVEHQDPPDEYQVRYEDTAFKDHQQPLEVKGQPLIPRPEVAQPKPQPPTLPLDTQ